VRDAALISAVQGAFWQLAEDLMWHHTNPWELDEALEAFGYATGPCAAQDLLGLDTVLARQPQRACPILPRMVAEGRHGKKTGVGYYRYPGGGGAVIDPLIEDLIREEAWFAKVERGELTDAELVARMNGGLAAACRDLDARADWTEVLPRAVHFPAGKIAALHL
jgi:3-hydroxyacyl-CoA dehydrogenase